MSRDARVLCEGVYFGEGPRWRLGRLRFSDFYARAVKSVSLAGDLRVEVKLDDAPGCDSNRCRVGWVCIDLAGGCGWRGWS